VTRWFCRGLVVLCCLGLSRVDEPLHGQALLGTTGPAAVLSQPVPVEQTTPARLGAPLAVTEVIASHDAVVPVQYVPPLGRREAAAEEAAEGGLLLPATIQLTLPGRQRLFRLDSEAQVLERIRQEARQGRTPTIIEFPEPMRFEEREKILLPRQWPLINEFVQPCYVFHGRLLSEQINSARYGWSLGVVQPLVSALHFYADVATLPYHLAEDPCRYDSSAGKCLPGDPVPLYLYPPHNSLSGLSAETAIITLLFFAFP
jgi:hypothetical protein